MASCLFLKLKKRCAVKFEEDVMDEVWQEHQFEMEAVEEQTEEANRLAQKFELVAETFGTAIKLALTLPYGEAIQVLQDAIEDNPGYGRDPVKG
ncbi:Uncharacterised protein [Leclercia adecarboxylata]|uniref:Uncharacterized protein n=1 Tax=Leclercia adecarboxylata TaxID=83655 RepID=A0A4U9HQR2_9ENTR|nr:Uncharacterised protein [Leclercia adecarboxylata]